MSESSIGSKSKSRLSEALALAVVAAAVLAILLVVPVPFEGRAYSSLMDLVHTPAFALLAWLICKAIPRRLGVGFWQKVIFVAVPLAGCGLFAEFIQKFVGRGASWHDARANLFGALAGVCLSELAANPSTRFRWPLRFAVLGMFLLGWFGPLVMLYECWQQKQQFPILASFENSLETSRFVAQDAKIERIPTSADQKNWGLEVDLLPGRYPGVLMDGLPGDWSAYHILSLDVFVTDGQPLDLIVKVHDEEHRQHGFVGDDRFDGLFHLEPGQHHLQIPLSEIRTAPRTREMDMTQIDGCQIFTYELTQPRTIILDNLRLE